MIKNNTDFDYAISKIINPTDPNIVKQEEILESSKFNMNFKEIESTLNTLYEKTRYLEDSIQYAKTFLETKNREFGNEMQSIMKELESLLDMTKNLAYISYNVPLIQNSVVINDRDSTFNNISPLILKDEVLTLGYSKSESYDISSIDRISNSIPYDDDFSNMNTTRKYKTIYLEEKVIPNGLTETFVVYFIEPVTVNILNFKPVNSKIKNIRFGLINGVEEPVSDYDLSIGNIYRTCSYIKFDLICTNFSMIEYTVLRSKVTENLWNDLKELELSTMSLTDSNKLQAECIISRTTVDKSTGEKVTKNYKDPNKVDGKTTTLRLYSYIFGLDDFSFMNSSLEKTGYFISDYINIGKLTELEYINLYVSHVKNDSTCIEYSILDGEKEIPIIPVGYEIVENEPIFNSVETRFGRDYNTSSVNYVKDIIKKDGQIADISFDDAINMDDGQYTITYKPNVSNHDITPINSEIRVKAYIRTYGFTDKRSIPYIDMITIRKFGEETLWTNSY